MPHEITMMETPVICEVLHRLNKTNKLVVGQLEDLLNLADRSGYPYLSTTDLRFNQYRTLFRQCGSEDVQRELLGALVAGSGWICQHLDASKDVNGDGIVDTDDILDGAVKANTAVSRILATAKGDLAAGSRRIGAENAANLHAAIDESMKFLLAVQQVVSHLSEPARRSA